MQAVSAYLYLARPRQWLKNGFVLLPLFFAHALAQPQALLRSLIATAAFCLLSSAVYAGNDVVDAQRDRLHPDKRERPVAAGRISRRGALGFAALLAVAALILACWLGTGLLAIALAYLLLQAVYTLRLKWIALLDVGAIALGFILRIMAGGMAAQVPLTLWIVLMASLLALLLALGKRHSDVFHARAHVAAPRLYTRTFLDRAMVVLALCVTLAYLFYTLSPEVLARHGQRPLYGSVPWVALGVGRYLWLAMREGAGGQPSRLVVSDGGILLCVCGWFATLAMILY